MNPLITFSMATSSIHLLEMQVVATLSLAAASSSAGVAILYSRDLDYCRSPTKIPCSKMEISVAFAFISWFLLAISSLVTFWLLGTV